MSASFKLYSKDYNIQVQIQDEDSQVLQINVQKLIKNEEDSHFVFIKRYYQQNLPQQFKQFKSIFAVFNYLQNIKSQIEIILNSLLIPFLGSWVQMTFQNQNLKSKIFVQQVNEVIQQRYEEIAISKKQKQEYEDSHKQSEKNMKKIKSNRNWSIYDDQVGYDIQMIYDKLYSFYERIRCQKNKKIIKKQKLNMMQLVDQIIDQHEQTNVKGKKLKNERTKNKRIILGSSQNQSENQFQCKRDEQIEKLKKKIMNLQKMLDTSKSNFLITIDKIKKQEQLKTKKQIFISIQDYVKENQSQVGRANLEKNKIAFLNQEDVKNYIKSMQDQIQELKYVIIEDWHNIRQLQNQIQQIKTPPSKFNNIFGQGQKWTF